MARTVVGLFDSAERAESAVQELLNIGVARDDISLIARDVHGEYGRAGSDPVREGAADGATAGALGGGVLGGLLGLLLGFGALTIPGLGPLVLAGPLASAIGSAAASTVVGAGVGAVSGGLLGALVGAGIPEDEASYYVEGIRRGGILVSATVDETLADRAYTTLQGYGAADMNEWGAGWSQEGRQEAQASAEIGAADAYIGGQPGDDKTRAAETAPLPASAPTETTPHNSGANQTVEYDSPAAREIEHGAAGNAERSTAEHPAPLGQKEDNVPEAWEQSDKIGTAAGTIAGAAGGAAIGAVGGVPGAVVGGIAGAAMGAGLGAAGDISGDHEDDDRHESQESEDQKTDGPEEPHNREQDRY